MGEPILLAGYLNYSSWSIRAWLAMRQCYGEFDAQVFNLADPQDRARVREIIPTGRVPALRHGDLLIWDSLAIVEYLAELRPEAGLWPGAAAARATARAVCAEMHSGFAAIRTSMPVNVRRRNPGRERSEEVAREIERIQAIWNDCRERFGADGSFLFGPWCAADAFFAPVVSRFRTYGVSVRGDAAAYVADVWEHPFVGAWRRAAEAEPWNNPAYDL